MRTATPWALALAWGCGSGGREGPWFREVTETAGIAFEHESGASGRLLLPEMNSAGVALFDAEGDGDLDLYLVNGARLDPEPIETPDLTNRFYRQEGEGGELRFRDRTAEAGLGDPGYGMGVAIGDLDNDGDPDLVATNYGPDRLYVNAGEGRFHLEDRGLASNGFSTSAAFFDADRDGFLDLYVCAYVDFDPAKPCFNASGVRDYCGPLAFPPVPDFLYQNDGKGRLRDVSEAAGIAAKRAAGLGVVCADLDEDGWQDVYVANDGYANHLWRNQRDGTFTDEAVLEGVAVNMNGQPEAGMGVVAADFDGDLHLDLFLTHLREETNTLYLSRGPGKGYVDASSEAGAGAVSIPYTGFGTAAEDFDLDGDLDLVVVNGAVLRGPRRPGVRLADPWAFYAEPNLLFVGEPEGRLREASQLAPELCGPVEISRGLAAGDVNGDLGVDLLVGQVEGPARLFLDAVSRRGHGIAVRCRLAGSGRDAIGARLFVWAGGQGQVRTVGGGSSFLSYSPPVCVFGLGDETRYEALEVVWPDGTRERFPGGPADRPVVLVQGEGERG